MSVLIIILRRFPKLRYLGLGAVLSYGFGTPRASFGVLSDLISKLPANIRHVCLQIEGDPFRPEAEALKSEAARRGMTLDILSQSQGEGPLDFAFPPPQRSAP